jgi:hypothetical protein
MSGTGKLNPSTTPTDLSRSIIISHHNRFGMVLSHMNSTPMPSVIGQRPLEECKKSVEEEDNASSKCRYLGMI